MTNSTNHKHFYDLVVQWESVKSKNKTVNTAKQILCSSCKDIVYIAELKQKPEAVTEKEEN